MTELEEQEFIELIDCGDGNHYEILGLMLFSEFNADNYNERIYYLKTEMCDSKLKNDGLRYLNSAKTTLMHIQKKTPYDFELKKKLKRKLIVLILFAVTLDYTLTSAERKQLDIYGNRYGFSSNEICEIIEEQRKVYNFADIVN